MEIVNSADGTPIAFQQRGEGRAVVIVNGALSTAADAGELASALVDKVLGAGGVTEQETVARLKGADLLSTSAVYDDPEAGPTVLHFAVPLKAEGVTLPAIRLHAFDASAPAKLALALDAALGRIAQPAGAFAKDMK